MSILDTRILTEHVYENIRTMILEGELRPGEKIDKKALSEALGVSLTPINAAMSRLTGEKYIEQINRRGYFVKAYSQKDLTEMYEVRAGLESVAVRLCLERATDEELTRLADCFQGFSLPFSEADLARYTEADKRFHGSIVKLSSNSMIQEIDESTGYLLKSYQQGLVRPPEETLSEHFEIVAAIRARDVDIAETLIARHHLRSADAVARGADPKNAHDTSGNP